MADPRKRPAIVIRTIEAQRSSHRPELTETRYAEQLRKIARNGIRVPATPSR